MGMNSRISVTLNPNSHLLERSARIDLDDLKTKESIESFIKASIACPSIQNFNILTKRGGLSVTEIHKLILLSEGNSNVLSIHITKPHEALGIDAKALPDTDPQSQYALNTLNNQLERNKLKHSSNVGTALTNLNIIAKMLYPKEENKFTKNPNTSNVPFESFRLLVSNADEISKVFKKYNIEVTVKSGTPPTLILNQANAALINKHFAEISEDIKKIVASKDLKDSKAYKAAAMPAASKAVPAATVASLSQNDIDKICANYITEIKKLLKEGIVNIGHPKFDALLVSFIDNKHHAFKDDRVVVGNICKALAKVHHEDSKLELATTSTKFIDKVKEQKNAGSETATRFITLVEAAQTFKHNVQPPHSAVPLRNAPSPSSESLSTPKLKG